MNLCIRLPFKRSPFLALHFCRWGTHYRIGYCHRTVWKIGIGFGRMVYPECGHYRCMSPFQIFIPQSITSMGHWKFWHINGAWS